MTKELAKNLLRPILNPLRPGNIVMFHIGRCGSTVLASLLDQHNNVMWASEFYVPIFRDWERRNGGKEIAGDMPADAIVLLKEHMRKALHRYYGFEIKPFHLRLIGYHMDSFINHLEEMEFSHYIILDRRNRLKKIISSVIAHQDRLRYHQNKEARPRLKQVNLDVDRVGIDYECKPLLSFLADYDDQVSSLEEKLEKKNLLNLVYEDDVQDDPRVGYRKICDFLSITAKEVQVDLSRTNPFPVRDMIQNYDEVEATLGGTKYEWMLNE